MSKIGYARVSSKEQNLDRQLEALQSVSKVFSDKASGQSTERPQLQAMLDYLREGWNGNSFFYKFYKVQNFFPYAIPIVLDNEPPRM